MAADLWERAAKMARGGDLEGASDVVRQAEFVACYDHCEGDYCNGLVDANVETEAIDDAVAAIARGEDPPDSLPGRLIERHRRELRKASSATSATSANSHGYYAAAIGDVISMLGCEVPTLADTRARILASKS